MRITEKILRDLKVCESGIIKFNNTPELHDIPDNLHRIIITDDYYTFQDFDKFLNVYDHKICDILEFKSEIKFCQNLYDNDGLLIFSYDGENITQYEYDQNKNILKILLNAEIYDEMEYDKNNNMTFKRFFDGSWIRNTFNEQNQLLRVSESEGGWEEHTYDENGNEIRFENSLGYWEESVVKDDKIINYKTSSGHWKKYEYDGDNLIKYQTKEITKLYKYDENGNLIETKAFSNRSNQEIFSENWSYDSHILQEYFISLGIDFSKDVFDNLEDGKKRILYRNSTGFWKITEYDKDENEVYFETSNGSWKKSKYENGKFLSSIDSSNEIVENIYDVNGNLINSKKSNIKRSNDNLQNYNMSKIEFVIK